jgi:hypothetical protein
MKSALGKATGTAALAMCMAGALGCSHGGYYQVTALPQHEVVAGRLDAHWFQRDVYAPGSKDLSAVELVYCPIVRDGPTVCRTAVVWQDGVTSLLEGSAGQAK